MPSLTLAGINRRLITKRYILSTMPVFWADLSRHDGNQFVSDDTYGHLATVTGALWTPQGRTFNGTSDKIVLGSNALFDIGASSYSVGCWFKYATAATDKPFFNSQVIVGHRRINLRSSAFSRQGPTSGIQEKTWAAPSANVWHHIFGVYDRAAATLEGFVDGVSQGTTGSIVDEALNNSNLNEIGTWSALNFWFAGTIGEVWFYSRALIQTEIQHNYLATKWRYQ